MDKMKEVAALILYYSILRFLPVTDNARLGINCKVRGPLSISIGDNPMLG